MSEHQATTADPSQITNQQAFLIEDTGLSWLEICGQDAADFLHRMLTRSILDMQVGETRFAWLLDSGGKILSNLCLLRSQYEQFVVGIPKDYARTVHQALDRYLIMEETDIRPRQDWTGFSLEGHTIPEELKNFFAPDIFKMARTHSGLAGFTLVGSETAIEKARQNLDSFSLNHLQREDLDLIRLKNFYPQFDCDMKPGVNPLIYGTDIGYIDHGKGCYIGQETVAMTRDRGKPPSLLVLLESQTAELEASDVFHEGKSLGSFHTHAFDAQAQRHLAMATLKSRPLEKGINTFYDSKSQAWQVLRISKYKAN
jgi:folate-binding protein YgfZ